MPKNLRNIEKKKLFSKKYLSLQKNNNHDRIKYKKKI